MHRGRLGLTLILRLKARLKVRLKVTVKVKVKVKVEVGMYTLNAICAGGPGPRGAGHGHHAC